MSRVTFSFRLGSAGATSSLTRPAQALPFSPATPRGSEGPGLSGPSPLWDIRARKKHGTPLPRGTGRRVRRGGWSTLKRNFRASGDPVLRVPGPDGDLDFSP